MLCRDQKKRTTATEILKNPFIAKHLEVTNEIEIKESQHTNRKTHNY